MIPFNKVDLEIEQGITIERCPIHDVPTQFYCLDCKRMTCRNCFCCKAHKIKVLSVISKKHEKEMTPELICDYIENCNSLLKQVNNNYLKTGGEYSKLMDDVNSMELRVTQQEDGFSNDKNLIKSTVNYLKQVKSKT